MKQYGNLTEVSNLVAISGTFSESLTVSGVPVNTGPSGSPTVTLQDAYDDGDGIITTAPAKPFQITGSGVVQGDLEVGGNYQGLPRSILIENPNGAENLSFFLTPTDEEVSKIIPTISGSVSDTGIIWSLRFDSDRSNHTGATEVITGGSETHDGNSGVSITSFDNASIPSDSYVWLETTTVSGSMEELALTVLF